MNLTIKRNWRNAGGIFIGIQYHFPVTVVSDDDQIRWAKRSIHIGLIAWTIIIDWKQDIRNIGT